jgi:ribonuclease P protein component
MQSNGRKLFTPLALIVVSETEKEISRLGVVVSKRVDKRAVVRNRIKRYFREIFRGWGVWRSIFIY